jgi:hypothetical protein
MTLIKMMTINELMNKIEKLQTEKTQLNNEIKRLKLEADGKTLMLKKEISTLREEAESLRELISS